jgi:hypothetical protein
MNQAKHVSSTKRLCRTAQRLSKQAEKLGLKIVVDGQSVKAVPREHCPGFFKDLLREHQAEFLAWWG